MSDADASNWVYRPTLDIHQFGDVQSAVGDYMRFYETQVTKCVDASTRDHFASRAEELRRLRDYLRSVGGEFLPPPKPDQNQTENQQ